MHIFFVRTLHGINGISISPSIALVADVTTVNDFRATAHEIGHLLGLSHVFGSKSRLLFQGVNGTTLVDSEIEIAHTSAEFLEMM